MEWAGCACLCTWMRECVCLGETVCGSEMWLAEIEWGGVGWEVMPCAPSKCSK